MKSARATWPLVSPLLVAIAGCGGGEGASVAAAPADSATTGMASAGPSGDPVPAADPVEAEQPAAPPAASMPAAPTQMPTTQPPDESPATDMPAEPGFGLAPEFDPVAEGYVELPLFEGDPPLYKPDAPDEFLVENDMIRNVSRPALRRHAFDAEKATGVGLIVFPGGGYFLLDIETHATALAERLGPEGIAVFALKYRCGDGADDVPAAALLDAKRALRLVRANAGQWGVDPDLVGAAGYSAGSHLVLSLASQFDDGQAGSADRVEQQSSRPAFVASLSSWAFGEPSSPFVFPNEAPPTFLAHAEDDGGAPIALARDVARQLQELDVAVQLLEIPTGGHSAFHVGDPEAAGRDWTETFLPWLREQQVLPPAE